MIEITFPNGGHIDINDGVVIRSGVAPKKFVQDIIDSMDGIVDSPSTPDPDHARARRVIEVLFDLGEGKITKNTYDQRFNPNVVY